MGISAINGNLVLDGDVFRIADEQPVFDDNGDNPHAPFLVKPSPYLSNLNLVHFQVRADERGTQAWSAPSLNDVVIDNRVIATAEAPAPLAVILPGSRFFTRITGSPFGCQANYRRAAAPRPICRFCLTNSTPHP